MHFSFVELSRTDRSWNRKFLPQINKAKIMCRRLFDDDIEGYITWARGESDSTAATPFYSFDYFIGLEHENALRGFVFLNKRSDTRIHIDMLCSEQKYGSRMIQGVVASLSDFSLQTTELTLECRPGLKRFYEKNGFQQTGMNPMDLLWIDLTNDVRYMTSNPDTINTESSRLHINYISMMQAYTNKEENPSGINRFVKDFMLFSKGTNENIIHGVLVKNWNNIESFFSDIQPTRSPYVIKMNRVINELTPRGLPGDSIKTLHKKEPKRHIIKPTRFGRTPKRSSRLPAPIHKSAGFSDSYRRSLAQKGVSTSTDRKRSQTYQEGEK